MTLRVCHLGKYYPPCRGGIETHVQTLAKAQAALGAEVHVVCVNHMDEDGRVVTHDATARTRTIEERDGPVRVTRVGRVASVYRFDACPRLPALLAQLRSARVDLIHLHVPNPAMLLGLATLPLSVPLVITHHSDIVSQRFLGKVVRPIEQSVYRRASLILSDSPTYAGGSPLLQRHAAKTRVLPLGLVLEPFRKPSAAALAHAAQLGEAHGEPLWLSVGRLVYYKGLETGLRALTQAPGKLLVVGEGPGLGSLQALARELGLGARVEWLGDVSQDFLEGAYLAATALWLPSNARSEGFGQVQVEAMACGRPVINCAIPHSGVPWVSQHEVSGLTVPVGDPAAFARAAIRLIEDPGLRERLSLGARERASSEFDHVVMARRSLDLYREVLDRMA